MNEKVFLDEIVSDYYSNVSKTPVNFLKKGQIVLTYFLYGYENLEVWRPARLDDSKTIARTFEICSSPGDKFKRRIPLSVPRLSLREEFIVVKAKLRPAVVIALPPAKIPIKDIRGGGKMNLDLILLAPLFTIEDDYGKAKYPEEFVNRVRRLMYPHLFFLPEHEQLNIKHSLCRFDRISPAYLTHLEPEDLCLTGEASDVFFSQLQCYLSDNIEGDYKSAYELLNN